MSFSENLPAQLDTVNYLTEQAEKHGGALIVGGHSKGGHLAVYASMNVHKKIQDRITDIYNNDGPGYLNKVQTLASYKRIKPKIHTIMSNHAVVGMLLNYEKDGVQIIKCPYTGVKAHDGFNWEVEGNHFVECEEYSMDAIAFRDTLNEVIKDISFEQRVVIVNAVFDILESTGAKTATEFAETEWKDLWGVMNKLRKTPGVSGFAKDFLSLFAKKSAAAVYGRITD